LYRKPPKHKDKQEEELNKGYTKQEKTMNKIKEGSP
jgi:hypothetical protein